MSATLILPGNSNIGLIGGFAGTESTPAQRTANAQSKLDGTGLSHILKISNNAHLDGLILVNADATSAEGQGYIMFVFCFVFITQNRNQFLCDPCVLCFDKLYFHKTQNTKIIKKIQKKNKDRFGGGIYIEATGKATITANNLLIANNTAIQGFFVFLFFFFAPKKIKSFFLKNFKTQQQIKIRKGGGIYAFATVDLTMTDCRFEMNHAIDSDTVGGYGG